MIIGRIINEDLEYKGNKLLRVFCMFPYLITMKYDYK